MALLAAALSAGCSENRAEFAVLDLEVDIEGCSFDEGQALRQAYASWSSASVLVLELDPIEQELRVCDSSNDAVCVSEPGHEESAGKLEETAADGSPTTASYSMTVDHSTQIHIDRATQALELSFSLSRTVACKGHCDTVPADECTINIIWSGQTQDDLSFYAPR